MMRDPQTTQFYCVADDLWFDTPARMADEDSRFGPATGPVADGWRRSGQGLWSVHLPEDRTLPEQGWKIHVSALPADAEDTLSVVAQVCLRDHVPFKFLRSRAALAFANDKYMPRSGSGKFITVYPADEAEFEAVATELADRLAGRDAPYVLSDLRIGTGPVFARYGAFVDLWCRDDSGAEVPALRDPSGRLVPDERDAVFRTPRWLPLPGWLGPHLAARAAAHDPSFPYVVRRALHFSNAGGIYLAEHRSTGETVVLREARPHSGLDAAGADAVRRLRREHAALERLAGVPGVPRVYGIHQVWEHVFLVEEHIEGERLLEAVIARNPVVWTNASAEDMAGYARWAGTVVDGLERLLARIHARGMRFGDLHPGNVIVRPDGSVALVDFEYAADLADRGTPWAGAPGFSAPPGADPVEVDRYGLWSTWLMMLLPLTEMLDHDPSRAELLTSVAEHLFGLPPGSAPQRPRHAAPLRPVATARSAGGGRARVGGKAGGPVAGGQASRSDQNGQNGPLRPEGVPGTWPLLRDGLVAGVHASAGTGRDDRLFPGDPEMFRTGGHTLAHGAAGVLLALDAVGEPVPQRYGDWLVDAARRARPDQAGGLFDGLFGPAVVLARLGRLDDGLALLRQALDGPPPQAGGLHSGAAGIGLALCHFAELTGSDEWWERAVRLADGPDAAGAPGAGESEAGLVRGRTGDAVLRLRLYGTDGERRHLTAARAALAADLAACVAMRDGTRQVRRGHRHLLYLDGGSAGIALAARRLLEVSGEDDPELEAFAAAVLPGCDPRFVREPGLLQGRAGLLAALAALCPPQERVRRVERQVERLTWHLVARDGGLLVPGDRLRRFSADLATGSAGVLLALAAAHAPSASPAEALIDLLTARPAPAPRSLEPAVP